MDAPRYPLISNAVTGTMTIRHASGITIKLTGSMDHISYTGRYTTSTGVQGTFGFGHSIP